MEKEGLNPKVKYVLIGIIVILILGIVSLGYYAIKANDKVQKLEQEQKKEERKKKAEEKKKKEEEKQNQVKNTPTAPANPTITLNSVGQSLMNGLSYMDITNSTGKDSGCSYPGGNDKLSKITDQQKIKEIISHIQVGTQINSLPQDGRPMQSCGGIIISLYYNDGTTSRIWFSDKNYMVINSHIPKNGGEAQGIFFYYFDTIDLYNYLEQTNNSL